MHVCYLCNEYPPIIHGGIGTFTQTLGRALVLHGHRVSVIGIYNQNELAIENDRGVIVYRIPASSVPKTGYFINGWRLHQVLTEVWQKDPIDILDGPELSFSLISKSFPSKKIIRMNGGHHFFAVTLGNKPKPWRSWLERQSFRKVDYFCAVSSYVGDCTKALLGLKQPIVVIPNPVDSVLFAPTQTCEDYGLIAFIGTVCEKKGIRQLMQAMPLILDAYPAARLLVIGRDQYDQKLKKSFTEYLKQTFDAKILSHVYFLGGVNHNELPALLDKVSICAYPSHMEAMPVAWLEGMAMGKAVVASETGPGTEIIEDGENGLLCNPYDPNSIAGNIKYALSDLSLRKKLGLAARKKIEAEFSADVLVERNLDFYRKCLLTVG